MFQVEADNMDEIQKKIINALLDKGNRVQPRGQWINEINGFSFKLNNPRSRLIYNPDRKYSLTFAIGEFLWYLRGSNKLDIMQYYNKRYPQFSDDGEILYGAYGTRIFGKNLSNGFSQWEMVLNKLREDSDTRQAIISIYGADDISAKTIDVPCTCTIQYFIRDNKLNCIVNMRSNDIIWGTSYDVFSFTMLQELLASMLKIELGWYMHFAGSMHIYDRHFPMAQKMISNNDYKIFSMPKMFDVSEMCLKNVLLSEEKMRQGLCECGDIKLRDKYWNDLLKILDIYSKSKRLDRIENEIKEIPECYRSILVNEKQIRELF